MRPIRYALLLCALLSGCDRNAPRLVLGTTHTVEDSGLLEPLVAAYRASEDAHELAVIVAGSGEILTMARNRDLDVLLTHSPDDEQAFIAAGHGESRQPVMYNDFILLGPVADPAGAAAARAAPAALVAVNAANAQFISRGDDSGTHRKERALWANGNVVPQWPGYTEAGVGMAEALRLANQRQAYILADRATYEKLRNELTQLRIVFEGDERMRNQYSVIVVDSANNVAGARAFAQWIRATDAQRLIAAHGTDHRGRPLFTPDAR
jgi:tungstate transport system substrate-binding protein